jgi:ribulose-phosphate 3-epimerase
MVVRINPSILAADFVNLERDLGLISGADFVHVDVMDGHFVPNLTFGPQMVERIHDVSTIPLDVHLMIDDNDVWAPRYAEIGAKSVTFHVESTDDPVKLARRIREIGSRVGIALKPDTPFADIHEIAHEFDQILVMTVEPGFGGQKFMDNQMEKVRAVSEFRESSGVEMWIQVDGGVDEDTIGRAAEAGADTFVAGSAVFGVDNPELAISRLRANAENHQHTKEKNGQAGN